MRCSSRACATPGAGSCCVTCGAAGCAARSPFFFASTPGYSTGAAGCGWWLPAAPQREPICLRPAAAARAAALPLVPTLVRNAGGAAAEPCIAVAPLVSTDTSHTHLYVPRWCLLLQRPLCVAVLHGVLACMRPTTSPRGGVVCGAVCAAPLPLLPGLTT